MKIAFLIAIVLSVLAGLTAIFGETSPSISAIENILWRIPSAAFCLINLAWALGIKKKKAYGWWIGSFLIWFSAVGFLGNITNVMGQESPSFMIWIVVSQLLCASIPVLIYFKWWKPKRFIYFANEPQAEPSALGNADKPLA